MVTHSIQKWEAHSRLGKTGDDLRYLIYELNLNKFRQCVFPIQAESFRSEDERRLVCLHCPHIAERFQSLTGMCISS